MFTYKIFQTEMLLRLRQNYMLIIYMLTNFCYLIINKTFVLYKWNYSIRNVLKV